MIDKRNLRKQVRKDFAYTPALETNLRKKFQQILKQKQQEPKAPRGWSNTELTQEELNESYKLMQSDYETMGDPYKQGESNESR
jgi:hypothetical protein